MGNKERGRERKGSEVKLLMKTEEAQQRKVRLTPGTPRHRQVFLLHRCFSQSVRLSIIFLAFFLLTPLPRYMTRFCQLNKSLDNPRLMILHFFSSKYVLF